MTKRQIHLIVNLTLIFILIINLSFSLSIFVVQNRHERISSFSHISSNYSSDITLDTEQLFPTRISSVNLNAEVNYLYTSFNITINYIQQIRDNGSFFIDQIDIKGNITSVSALDKDNKDVLMLTFYNQTNGYTVLKIKLNQILFVGEKYPVNLIFFKQTETIVNYKQLDFDIRFSQKVSVFSAKIFMSTSLILYYSSPSPQTIQTIGNKIQMTWDSVEIENFAVIIQYKVSKVMKSFQLNPAYWEIGNIPSTVKKISHTVSILNLLDIPQKINISTNDTFVKASVYSIELSPHEQQSIMIEIKIKELGNISATLLFSSNVSSTTANFKITAYVYRYFDTWIIISLFMFSAVIGLIIVIYLLLLKIKEHKLKKREIEEALIHGSKARYNLDRIKEFFNEREFKVLKIALNEPGLNQAAIASKSLLSQATVSRILTKLERKGVIEKRVVGMSSLIYPNKSSELLIFLNENEESNDNKKIDDNNNNNNNN